MRFLILAAVLFSLAIQECEAAAAPAPKPKKEVGPVEIDFSPMEGVMSFTITLTIEFENDQKLDKQRAIGEDDAPYRALHIRISCQEALKGAKIDCESVNDDAKLVIKGYKGNGVLKVEIEAKDKNGELPKAKQPKVRRLPQKKQQKM